MSNISLTSNIKNVIIDYLEYCEIEKNLSPNTIKMYDFYLNDFTQWAKDKLKKDELTLSDLQEDLIKKYRVNLNRRISSKSHLEYKRSTQKTFLVALRAFLKYLVVVHDLEPMSPEKIILGKFQDSVPKVLTADQLARMFEVQDLNKLSGLRDRTILEVLFSTGLRVSELASLDVDSINLKSKEFTVIGKGRKVRTVYLSDGAVNWLKRYMATRDDPFKPLFIRYSGKHMEPDDYDGESLRLTPRSIQRLVKKYVKRAGVAVDATPHTMRHTFATLLLQEGADIRSVQELLGHSSVATTQIYTHVTNARLKDVHEMFHRDLDSGDIEPSAAETAASAEATAADKDVPAGGFSLAD
jgi:site-specific recombinase XerD